MAEIITENTDLNSLAKLLEEKELESHNCIVTTEEYEQLLSIYLLQKDLTNAKFLWKRIPANLKTANCELNKIWKVCEKLWQRDSAAIYESLKIEWSPHLQPYMNILTEKLRTSYLHLISQAYTCIATAQLADCLGISKEQAIEKAVSSGWTYDEANQFLIPYISDSITEPIVNSCEKNLSSFTKFISFLEN